MIRAALAAALLLLTAAPAATQEPLRLGRDEGRALAAQLLAEGRPDAAAAIARALLEADPQDPGALAILARAAFEAGEMAAARQAAAAIWDSGAPVETRLGAARLAARAAAGEERFFVSELWYRRALTLAGPDRVPAIEDEARAMRRLSPWSVSLSFSIRPSANVNGGAETGDYVVNGETLGALTVAAQALDGWIAETDLALGYRLAQDATSRTSLRFDLSDRHVRLSGRSRNALEEAGEETIDVSTRSVEIGLDHVRLIGPSRVDLGLSLGRVAAGGEAIYDVAGFEARLSRPLGEADRLSFSLSQDWRERTDGGTERLAEGGLAWTHAWPGGGVTRAGVELSRLSTERANTAFRRASLDVTHRLAQPLGPAELTLGGAVSVTEFDDYFVFDFPTFSFVDAGRRDRRALLTVEAALTGWSWAGFTPVATLEAERTFSNNSRFDSRNLGFGVEIRSTF
ncbi:tetratricopeptide repeat protein [Wenxinia saemankumensis]|uniref:Tetratricopeptide repeat-containing protein n=1 Tax=Wenxinia saemankumensis TaxID=1447782 RepID=A0A1M6CEF8_9RHOB|nr:tetratricopeptide repeat protein [Wenxinia saemankumensis]SHI59366.1 Tetratricopeptide repeat-containing protein [Wenxinia saemankumensis]